MVNGDLPCTVGRHIVKLGTFEHRSTNFEHYLGSCNKPLANKKSFGKCLRTESLVVQDVQLEIFRLIIVFVRKWTTLTLHLTWN